MAAAVYLEGATAAACFCALVLVLCGYLREYPIEPWLSVARTSASLMSSAFLLGAILAVPDDEVSGEP